MNDYKFIGYLEEKKENRDEFALNVVCRNEKDGLYYYGSTFNTGFMVYSTSYETLEELYNDWYIMEVLDND